MAPSVLLGTLCDGGKGLIYAHVSKNQYLIVSIIKSVCSNTSSFLDIFFFDKTKSGSFFAFKNQVWKDATINQLISNHPSSQPRNLMEKVFKVIFRLDFPIHYSIMDSPGTVLRMLQHEGEEAWSTQSIGQKPLPEYKVQKNGDENAFSLTVSATSITGLWDTKSLIALKDIHESHVFRLLTKLTDEILKGFEISQLTRCGIRTLFYLPCGTTTKNAWNILSRSIGGNSIDITKNSFGIATDFGISLEDVFGEHSGFRVSFGPLAPSQPHQFWELLEYKEGDHPVHGAIMADVDSFDKNFSMPYSSFRRWCRDRWQRFYNFSGDLVKLTNCSTTGE
ncbi:MAG: hypothetical protein H7839_05180 [Magnetococcus sp. YQC-5]